MESTTKRFGATAYGSPDDLLFGRAKHPVRTKSGLELGAGAVLPEINFTLPTMPVNAGTMPEVCSQYRQMIQGVLRRAAELEVPGLVVEFETLPPMTENPDWGMDVVTLLLEAMEDARAKHGLRSALRLTPNDTREMERPPRMRSGALLDGMLELFDRGAAAGADLLSIESVGGKEVCDDALTMGDLHGVLFSLCVMAPRDMEFLWSRICGIASTNGAIAAGDTACGFANTAMVLAEQRMIPRVFAAVVRAVSAVRSLVAYECGAVGPGKDCAYENVILKAITGYPMAMEGRMSACAHLSPLGNVAAAAADTWSNESVQNVKLLGGMAPVVSVEQLAYDCRLFNRALQDGPDAARRLRDWMAEPDAALDPQALVLTPGCALEIARAIVAAPNRYQAGIAAARTALICIQEAHRENRLRLAHNELPWLDIMQRAIEDAPDEESDFVELVLPTLDQSKFRAVDYDLTEE
ncbi:MAG: methyltransferase MtaB domain-containing protein [Fimbriimonadales bacterium]